jgi:hypothetical protein
MLSLPIWPGADKQDSSAQAIYNKNACIEFPLFKALGGFFKGAALAWLIVKV